MARVKGDMLLLKPKIVCIQADPMQYLWHNRRLAFENMPLMRAFQERDKQQIND